MLLSPPSVRFPKGATIFQSAWIVIIHTFQNQSIIAFTKKEFNKSHHDQVRTSVVGNYKRKSEQRYCVDTNAVFGCGINEKSGERTWGPSFCIPGTPRPSAFPIPVLQLPLIQQKLPKILLG